MTHGNQIALEAFLAKPVVHLNRDRHPAGEEDDAG
jgi:hypothetical protein